MDEIRVIGYCAHCGDKITSEAEECCCNEDGEYFCDIECALEKCGIHRLEI